MKEWMSVPLDTIGWAFSLSWAISFAYDFSYDRKTLWDLVELPLSLQQQSWHNKETRSFPCLLPAPNYRALRHSSAWPLRSKDPGGNWQRAQWGCRIRTIFCYKYTTEVEERSRQKMATSAVGSIAVLNLGVRSSVKEPLTWTSI